MKLGQGGPMLMSDVVKSMVQQKVNQDLSEDPHPKQGKSTKDKIMHQRSNTVAAGKRTTGGAGLGSNGLNKLKPMRNAPRQASLNASFEIINSMHNMFNDWADNQPLPKQPQLQQMHMVP